MRHAWFRGIKTANHEQTTVEDRLGYSFSYKEKFTKSISARLRASHGVTIA